MKLTQMEFPRMTEDQLRELCFSVYHVKKARTYAEAHLSKTTGNFNWKLQCIVLQLYGVR